MSPDYPIYIVSKGRYQNERRLTSNYLSKIKIPHYIIVEQSEYDDYKKAIGSNPYITLLILDKSFQDNYKTLDNLGYSKSKGPGPARNFAWHHALSNQFDYHWVMDDNIKCFYYYHKNRKIRIGDGTIFAVMENFCHHYKNLYMAGPQYEMFIARREKNYSLIFNTRIYSCNLIKNKIPFEWRGRYNEDTILSLDILSSGYCTTIFKVFLQQKINTQKIKGGNTKEFYKNEGTGPKTDMLIKVYPKITKKVMRYGRIHHNVDYSSFAKNRLIRNPAANTKDFNMVLRSIATESR